MSKIFISYRRSDSDHVTGRIYDRLVKNFGKDDIFKDVDSIPAAIDYYEHIKETIKSCDLVLLIMGSTWLTVVDKKGEVRLEDANDMVRFEIETALSYGISILPVFLDNTSMPEKEMLPESIRSLTRINGLSVRRDPDFNNDIRRLIAAIKTIIEAKERAKPNQLLTFVKKPYFKPIALVLLFVVIAVLYFLLFGQSSKVAQIIPAIDSLQMMKNATNTKSAVNDTGNTKPVLNDTADLKIPLNETANNKEARSIKVYFVFTGVNSQATLSIVANGIVLADYKVDKSGVIETHLKPGEYVFTTSGSTMGKANIRIDGINIITKPATPMIFNTGLFLESFLVTVN